MSEVKWADFQGEELCDMARHQHRTERWTDIQARIPGHGEDNIIAWQSGFMDENEEDCGGWAFTTDQGATAMLDRWRLLGSNEDDAPSVEPTHWKPAPPEAKPSDHTSRTYRSCAWLAARFCRIISPRNIPV